MLLLLLACTPPPPTDSSCTFEEPAGSGLFDVVELCGRWWFVPPEGGRFWSAGVNAATPTGSRNGVTGEYAYAEAVQARYGTEEAWGEATTDRLLSWGFNTSGSWSRSELLDLPATVNLKLSGGDWESGELADWWSPEWEALVESQVEAQVLPRVGDPMVLGWFLDNEIKWGPDWRGTDTLLEEYLALGPQAPGKAIAVDLLLAELGDVQDCNAALGTTFADRDAMLAEQTWELEDDALSEAFLALAAERYFSFTTDSIRVTDPDHLILGNREVSVLTHELVWSTAARHVDVLSANNYVFRDGVADAALAVSSGLDPEGFLEPQHELTGLPILVTEFGFRADDAGLPNSWPPIYPNYEDQAARAQAFEDYITQAQASPWIVGAHWFAWVDQPVDGRFDGEDNNWGLVNEVDEPYALLVERTAEVFGREL